MLKNLTDYKFVMTKYFFHFGRLQLLYHMMKKINICLFLCTWVYFPSPSRPSPAGNKWPLATAYLCLGFLLLMCVVVCSKISTPLLK